MILIPTFMVILNLLRVSFEVSGNIPSTSNNIIIDYSKNKINKRVKKVDISEITESSELKVIEPTQTTKLTNPSKNNFHSSLQTSNPDILAEIWHFFELWSSKANTSDDSRLYKKIDDFVAKITNELPSRLHNLGFFQLWKEISDWNNGNFTLKYAPSNGSDLYGWKPMDRDLNNGTDDYTRHVSQMKGILVKDRRYEFLIKKWITNRHGRDISIKNNSRDLTETKMSNSTEKLCDSCSSQFADVTKSNSTCVHSAVNATETQTKCDTSNLHDKSSKSNDKDGPEVRFYDPLMPYPEEYPEEYQTIQNGPALIISRTTYTRIPNVTYTTITMVTLPTYRLVEKAENGFAETLFEERRSSKSNNISARCDQHSSTDFLPKRRQ